MAKMLIKHKVKLSAYNYIALRQLAKCFVLCTAGAGPIFYYLKDLNTLIWLTHFNLYCINYFFISSKTISYANSSARI